MRKKQKVQDKPFKKKLSQELLVYKRIRVWGLVSAEGVRKPAPGSLVIPMTISRSSSLRSYYNHMEAPSLDARAPKTGRDEVCLGRFTGHGNCSDALELGRHIPSVLYT